MASKQEHRHVCCFLQAQQRLIRGWGRRGEKKKKKAKVSSDCPLKTESVETHTVCAYRRLQVRLGYSSQEVKIYIQWCGYDITAQRISCLADAAILNCSSHEKKKKKDLLSQSFCS